MTSTVERRGAGPSGRSSRSSLTVTWASVSTRRVAKLVQQLGVERMSKRWHEAGPPASSAGLRLVTGGASGQYTTLLCASVLALR